MGKSAEAEAVGSSMGGGIQAAEGDREGEGEGEGEVTQLCDLISWPDGRQMLPGISSGSTGR